jgi:hypothetical protein
MSTETRLNAKINMKSRLTLGIIISLTTFATTGCGQSKVAQCGSFDKVAKEVAIAAKVFDSSDTKDPDKKAQIFSNGAAKGQELSNAFRSLDLQDEKLKGFQSSFAAIYEGYSKSFGQLSLAAKAKNAESFNQPMAELQSASVKEKALAKELAKYCTSQ